MMLMPATEDTVRTRQPRAVLLLMAVLCSAVAAGMVAARQPLMAVGAALAAPLAVAIMVLPDVSTLAVIFILYSNAAVIAVQFHGVPYLMGASVPLLLIIPLASYLIFRREKIIINPVLPLLLLFLAIEVVSAAFSENIDVSAGELFSFAIEGIGLYFLITNVVRTPETLRRVVWVLLIVGALLGSLSFYQQITHTYDNDYWGFAQMSNAMFGTGVENIQGQVLQQRLAGPIGEQNRYAQVMLMLVPLGLFRFWGERSPLLRGLALLATIFISIGAALTFSRGAAVGFVLMLVIMTLMRYIKPIQIVLVVLALVLVLMLVPQYATRLSTLETLSGVANQDSNAIASSDASIQSRLTEMLAAALVFTDHPVVGVGPGMFRYYYQDYAQLVGLRVLASDRQAHDLYLGIAAETGILGLTSFLAILFLTLRNLARTRKRWMQIHPEHANMAAGFMLALVSYMTTGIFLHFAFIRFFILILALASVVSYVSDVQVPTRIGQSRKDK